MHRAFYQLEQVDGWLRSWIRVSVELVGRQGLVNAQRLKTKSAWSMRNCTNGLRILHRTWVSLRLVKLGRSNVGHQQIAKLFESILLAFECEATRCKCVNMALRVRYLIRLNLANLSDKMAASSSTCLALSCAGEVW